MNDASSLSGLAMRTGSAWRKRTRVLLRDERGGERLVVAEREQAATQRSLLARRGQFDHSAGKRGQRAGNFEVGVDARDLFDEIDFALHIQAPGGHGDGELRAAAFDSKTQAAQDAGDLRRRNLHAEDALDFAGGERNARLRDRARHHVDLRGDHAARGGNDQLRDAGAGQPGDAAIGSALVAVRGVGVHAEAARGAADGGRIEPRGFDEHVARGVGNHGGFAAHHSGNAPRASRRRR